MAFQMYGDAILTRDVPESGLRAGDIGTVVELHVVPGVPEEGYSVRHRLIAPPCEPSAPDAGALTQLPKHFDLYCRPSSSFELAKTPLAFGFL